MDLDDVNFDKIYDFIRNKNEVYYADLVPFLYGDAWFGAVEQLAKEYSLITQIMLKPSTPSPSIENYPYHKFMDQILSVLCETTDLLDHTKFFIQPITLIWDGVVAQS